MLAELAKSRRRGMLLPDYPYGACLMEFLADSLFLSRLQFAFLAMFHILWPPLTIGLALIMLGLEVAWLRTGKIIYYHHLRWWMKFFLLNFGVGVVTGLPLEFAFGSNWGPFSIATGDFVGHILGFETVIAFMLEAGFLGVMLFGWGRVPRMLHLFATSMVALGTILSAFWIMVVSSWMQTPDGVAMVNGKIQVLDYSAAVFNRDFPYSFSHMLLACLQNSLVVVGAISAWYLLRRREVEFFLPAFKAAAVGLLVVGGTQVVVGDLVGANLAHTQPAKLAAIEAHWDTNKPGEGAPWSVLAVPDEEAGRNRWALEIPNVLSLIVTRDPHGEVRGLNEFAPEDRPPVWLPYYAFRLMVACGLFMLAVAAWSVLAWRRGWLQPQALSAQRWLLRAWLACLPAVYLAMEAGWVVREVGRQPWVVYGLMRTSEGAARLPAAQVQWSLLSFMLLYAVIGATAVWLAVRLVRKGPDLTLPPPPEPQLPGQGAQPGGY